MKKAAMVILIVTLMLVLFSAIAEEGTDTQLKGTDTLLGGIKIGMSLEEIEEIIQDEPQDIHHYDNGLSAWYRIYGYDLNTGDYSYPVIPDNSYHFLNNRLICVDMIWHSSENIEEYTILKQKVTEEYGEPEKHDPELIRQIIVALANKLDVTIDSEYVARQIYSNVVGWQPDSDTFILAYVNYDDYYYTCALVVNKEILDSAGTDLSQSRLAEDGERVLHGSDDENSSSAPSFLRLEGPGYDTPEEAVLAYLDAMNRDDVAGMLSTFAIETFGAHVDSMSYFQKYSSLAPFQSTATYGIPDPDDFARQLAANAHFTEIAGYLSNAYAINAAGYETRKVGSAEDLDTLVGQFRQSPLHEMAGHVDFVQWISPATMVKQELLARGIGKQMLLEKAYAGADDYTELLALVRINGKTAIQPMSCAKYGDRWYNLDFSTRSLYLSEYYNTAAMDVLWFPDDSAMEKIAETQSSEVYAAENARWEALQQSDRAGTRWPLVSLDTPVVTVHDMPEAAESDSGPGIWAEMHFTRLGGAEITIAASPAFREKFSLGDGSLRIYFPWLTDDIPTSYTQFKRNKEFYIPLFDLYNGNESQRLSDFTIDREETRITFTLADGTKAVFDQPASPATAPAAADDYQPVTRLEGNGYGTPEEAVRACIDALNRGSVHDMLATFAIETYAEHADPMLSIERYGIYSLKSFDCFLWSDHFGQSLLAYRRYASLVGSLARCWFSGAVEADRKILLKTNDDLNALLDLLQQSSMNHVAGNVSLVRWINPSNINEDLMTHPETRMAAAHQAVADGADDMVIRIAQLLVNGRTAYMPMRCIRYGDRWYNSSAAAEILWAYNVDTTKVNFLWIPTEEEQAAVEQMLNSEHKKGDAIWNAMQNSNLAGTRWPMVSMNNPNVKVYDSASDAEAESGTGISANIFFTGTGGGAMTIACSPAVQQKLGLGVSEIQILFTWQPDDSIAPGAIRLSNLSFVPCWEESIRDMINRSLYRFSSPEDTCAIITREGSVMTLTLEDGFRAIFEKP